MKKSVLWLGIIIVMLIFLVGCRQSSEEKVAPKNNIDTEKIQEIITKEDYNIPSEELYSDNYKLVFKPNDVTYSVFFYQGEEIIRYETYIKFESADLAEEAKKEYNQAPDKSSAVASVRTFGDFLILRYISNEYMNTTIDFLKNNYGEIEQIKSE